MALELRDSAAVATRTQDLVKINPEEVPLQMWRGLQGATAIWGAIVSW